MTALIPYQDTDLEYFWDGITEWLDKLFAATHTNHRILLDIENQLESLEQELTAMDYTIAVTLSPSQLISSTRLGLRFRDLETVMVNKWTSEAVRGSSLRALQGIHERYLGPIRDARRCEVVFEISRNFRNQDFGGYIEAHRREARARWVSKAQDVFGCSMTVVDAPLWVHDLYRHLTGDSLRGAELRRRYVQSSSSEWNKENAGRHFVGEPIECPSTEALEAALTLWEPEDERSPYQKLAGAVEAALLL